MGYWPNPDEENKDHVMPHMELAGVTHTGCVRRNNEDAFVLLEDLSAAIVADGMGGAQAGEVAAQLTVETVAQFLREPPAELQGADLLTAAARQANRKVYEKAQNGSDCAGMGSTLVVALWRGDKLQVANVGDSRAYLWRNGELKLLSYDQNLANELRVNLGLSEQQVSQYPHRHALTMAIGTAKQLQVRFREEDLADGDVVLLCTDGLSGTAGEGAIRAVLEDGGDLARMAGELIARANDAGGPDNITAVLLRWREQ